MGFPNSFKVCDQDCPEQHDYLMENIESLNDYIEILTKKRDELLKKIMKVSKNPIKTKTELEKRGVEILTSDAKSL